MGFDLESGRALDCNIHCEWLPCGSLKISSLHPTLWGAKLSNQDSVVPLMYIIHRHNFSRSRAPLVHLVYLIVKCKLK